MRAHLGHQKTRSREPFIPLPIQTSVCRDDIPLGDADWVAPNPRAVTLVAVRPEGINGIAFAAPSAITCASNGSPALKQMNHQ